VGIEIEKKYLVGAGAPVPDAAPQRLTQGYVVSGEAGVEVRVRVQDGDDYALTVKTSHGMVRGETEIALSKDQFDALWPLTEGRRVTKARYDVPLARGLVAEWDVYEGRLAGLQTVEVEFGSVEDAEAFEPPEWFGRDVTGDARLSNSRLATDGMPAL
jgi:CYTH domain-containing protein